MEIKLEPSVEKAFNDKIAHGVDPNRIIADGLSRVEEAEEYLEEELQKGLNDFERGDFVTLNSPEELRDMFNQINAEIDSELSFLDGLELSQRH